MTKRSRHNVQPTAAPAAVVSRIPPTSVLPRLAALQTADIAELKQQWRELCGTEPPPYNRKFLESRLAYRIQELAFGGLKPETVARLPQRVVLIDGQQLTALMVEHSVGVRTSRVLEVKRLDEDFFTEE